MEENIKKPSGQIMSIPVRVKWGARTGIMGFMISKKITSPAKNSKVL